MAGRPVIGLAPKGARSQGRVVVGLAPTPGAAKESGGGGGLGHLLAQTGIDLKNAALQTPGELVAVLKAAGHDAYLNARHPSHDTSQDQLLPIAEQVGKQTVETAKHPLRHPGDTLLLALPAVGKVAGAGERIAAAGAAAKRGEGAAAVVRAATRRPVVGQRTLTVGEMQTRGHYSRNPGARVVQKAADAALQKGATLPKNRGGLLIENRLNARAAKWNQRNERVVDAKARAAGTQLQALGKNLKPEELRALRLVAEETPVARRLGAQEMRKARATGKEVARHQQRIDLTKGAMQFLDEHPTTGAPVFKPEAAKLRSVFDQLKKTAGDRESMLKQLGLLDQAAQDAAKTKVARVAAGATVDKKTGEIVGASDVAASPGAVFIGNPVERTKIRGVPKVSSTGTFGHTQKPASLKVATGGSIEHALERGDVTQVVAERHAEAVRLSKIARATDRLAKAGEKAPRRKNDVWVWTDKTVSSGRIPKEVRGYLDNPESIAKLPPDKQQSITQQMKDAILEQHDWRDPQKLAEFTKLAEQGKGVFVPRKLMGDLVKRDYAPSHIPVVDEINNAQKAALVYLKLNYPVVQGLSNVAMNLIQQGPYAVVNLTRAARLSHGIGPEYAAVVDDIMGQGAVMQAAFEGTNAISRGSQALGRKMSHGVDTPARRAAFLHEAYRAGYNSPEKLKALLENDANLGDLSEVAQRAKEAIVDYSELGPVERGVIRRLVFVYPWQKGATKYAAHFLRDHPNQAAAAGILGEQGKQTSDTVFGPVPSYLEGLIPVGGRAVNPSGVNFLQTPAQIGEGIAGLVTGNPTTPEGQSFLAPFPGLAIGLATQRNDIGKPLTGNLGADVRDLTVAQAPVSALARAAAGGRQDVLGELVRKVFGSQRGTQTFPDVNDAYWKFGLGGLYPRRYDKGALNKNAARQKAGR